MSESDRATLLHAAELLERLNRTEYVLREVGLSFFDLPEPDLIATAKALREMAG